MSSLVLSSPLMASCMSVRLICVTYAWSLVVSSM